MVLPEHMRLYLFDKVLLGYSLFMVAALLLFGRPLAAYGDEIAFYISTALLVLIIGRYLNERDGRFRHFLRYLYPVLLFTFLYRATGGMMFLFFDHFFDPQLVAFEKAILGIHPTLYFDEHMLNVVTTEILSACYFLYYPLVPIFMAAVYIRGDYGVVKESMAAVCLTFVMSYLLFALYPVEGPRWHFAAAYLHEIEGPVFRPMVDLVIRNGAVRGGCMPSSHFGVTLVLLIYATRYYRRWLWLLVPVTLGLAGGTVWGRFHYVSDVVVGGLIALFAVFVAAKLAPDQSETAPKNQTAKELQPYHAS